MPLMRPPSNDRTAVPILTISFLLHAEKNTIRTDTVRGVGFNEFLQYTSFHKLLLIIYIISSLLPTIIPQIPCAFLKLQISLPHEELLSVHRQEDCQSRRSSLHPLAFSYQQEHRRWWRIGRHRRARWLGLRNTISLYCGPCKAS